MIAFKFVQIISCHPLLELGMLHIVLLLNLEVMLKYSIVFNVLVIRLRALTDQIKQEKFVEKLLQYISVICVTTSSSEG